jgi:bifunctional non-homologous end joining protein LigD
MPEFILPELPRLVTQVPEENGDWIYEMKYDGYRIQAHLKDGIGKLFTRSGLNWARIFPHILDEVENLNCKNAIFDGEIVALDQEGRSDFQKLQNSIKLKSDKDLRYCIFDLLYLNGKDLRSLPLFERKEILQKLLRSAPKNIIFSEHIPDRGQDFFKLACQMKLEGIIAKLSSAPYTSGRNDFWLKIKCQTRQEFVIGGWTEAKGGRNGFGSLLLGLYQKGKLRYVGRVGTGFNSASLKEIKELLKKIPTYKSPFDLNSPKERYLHWVRPQKVAEVSFGNWTDDKILRTPVFVGLRKDKLAKEIHMETATKLKEISSPDKILYKKEKITKKEVADFYQKIGKIMLPYLQDRPLSLVRCPSGSEGSCFFQKHISDHAPSSFHTVVIDKEKYFSINSLQALQELVQLNAFELHVWNSHDDKLENPDQFVMDLDPGPGVPWSEVISAAFELKEMLDDLKLKSFVKLTGGKGIHIHVPIAPSYSWDEVKSFSQVLALELVHRNPKKYVATMSKKLRQKKIFVDYLRNGRGATAVVPYSLRARETSAIALPLEWSELRRVKDPKAFTMKKALAKILSRKKDPWTGYLKLRQKISILDNNAKAA